MNDSNGARRRDAALATRTDLGEARFRQTHTVCDEHGDTATASLIEVWIEETERRTWFLFETTRAGD